jgi:hypothetical protein
MGIKRAEVIEVFNDLSLLTTSKLDQLLGRSPEPDHLPRMSSPDVVVRNMPRDSLRVRVVGDEHSVICYPFFPSHLRLPTKVGEEVWVFFEDFEQSSPTLFDPEKAASRSSVKDVVMSTRNLSTTPSENISLGYWMCRPTNERQVEDLNYTAFGRTKYASGFTMESAADVQQNSGRVSRTANFPAFAGTSDRLEEVSRSDELLKKRIEPFLGEFTLEPVARYTKSPGETVIAGSNDARIVLGQSRTGRPGSAGPDAGSVDIVAGTGKASTAPNTVANSYGQEVEKDPLLTGKQDVIAEGDPDFSSDLSRLMVAENIAVDQDFAATAETVVADVGEKTGPAIVARSQHVRILGTNDGSVRIIVEGPKKSSIVIDAAGNAHIDAESTVVVKSRKVILGTETTDSPRLDHGVFGGSDVRLLLAILAADLNSDVGLIVSAALPNFTAKLNEISGQGFTTLFSKTVFASR